MVTKESVPLEAHADVADDAGRPDSVEILTDQNATRLHELVPIRHGRMRVSPFTFYRGAAAIMASDLSRSASTGLRVQLCGDAHLSNFGLFKGPDRRLVFDVNDFDETCPGPFEWDLKRLAASVVIAGHHNELARKEVRAASRAAVRGYRETMAQAAARSPLDLHYFRLEVDALTATMSEKRRKRSGAAAAKATRKDSVRALAKLTEVVDGRPRIVERPPLITRHDETVELEREQLAQFFQSYVETLEPHRAAVIRQYRFVDIAHKIVGVGSVGTRCLIMLLESDQSAPLFLQFKEANPSVLEPYVGTSEFGQAGERVVRGQRLMQSTSDILLGWSRYERDHQNIDFYLRQLWDGKGSAEVDQMGPKRLRIYSKYCGAALALAHARSGDARAISAYLGNDDTADRVFTRFGEQYARLNELDFAAHESAIASGAITVVEGL